MGVHPSTEWEIPEKSDEILIYYIGKSEKNIVERIMQEVTQLIFGGFGTIIDKCWLEKNPYAARIHEKQESDKNRTMPLDKDVLYKSDGLHVLYDFFNNNQIQETLACMRERLIFTWIATDDILKIKGLENEMHHIVRTNCFGTGKIKTLKPKKNISIPAETPLFQKVNWNNNQLLKDWLTQVNNKII